MSALLLFVLLAANAVNVLLIVACFRAANENDDLIADLDQAITRLTERLAGRQDRQPK